MENNNNGRGIFYGVIGVATLVVAIIGATFAYFSASVTRNNIVNIGSTTLNLLIQDEQSNFRMDMIPVETVNNEGVANTAFYTFPGLTATDGATGNGTCRDLVGNSICSVYQFTVKNPSETTAQTVVGSLKVSTNTGFENLYYAVFKGAASGITSYNVNGESQETVTTSGTTQTAAAAGSVIVARKLIGDAGTTYDEDNSDWGNTTERLAPGGTTTYTVVIWLEETGENQEEQGQTFSAGITFTSDTGSGVTGILTTAG